MEATPHGDGEANGGGDRILDAPGIRSPTQGALTANSGGVAGRFPATGVDCHWQPIITLLIPEPIPNRPARMPGWSAPQAAAAARVRGRATEPVFPSQGEVT